MPMWWALLCRARTRGGNRGVAGFIKRTESVYLWYDSREHFPDPLEASAPSNAISRPSPSQSGYFPTTNPIFPSPGANLGEGQYHRRHPIIRSVPGFGRILQQTGRCDMSLRYCTWALTNANFGNGHSLGRVAAVYFRACTPCTYLVQDGRQCGGRPIHPCTIVLVLYLPQSR